MFRIQKCAIETLSNSIFFFFLFQSHQSMKTCIFYFWISVDIVFWLEICHFYYFPPNDAIFALFGIWRKYMFVPLGPLSQSPTPSLFPSFEVVCVCVSRLCTLSVHCMTFCPYEQAALFFIHSVPCVLFVRT